MTPLKLDNTTVVVEHVVGWRIDMLTVSTASGSERMPNTVVFMRHVQAPFIVRGDHSEALERAVGRVGHELLPNAM